MIIGNFIKGIELRYKNQYFSGICFDSSNCKKDNIYFAIKGTKIDGNKFINHAIQNGAKIIISNQKFKRQDVKLGISDGVNAELISGVSKTDKIKVWNKTEPNKRGEEEDNGWN